jgi:hypothetical protein
MNIDNIPDDVLYEIYQRLGLSARKNLQLVSKKIKENIDYNQLKLTNINLPYFEQQNAIELKIGENAITNSNKTKIIYVHLDDQIISIDDKKFSKIPNEIYNKELYKLYYCTISNYCYILITPFYIEIYNEIYNENFNKIYRKTYNTIYNESSIGTYNRLRNKFTKFDYDYDEMADKIFRFNNNQYITHFWHHYIKTENELYKFRNGNSFEISKLEYISYKNLYFIREYDMINSVLYIDQNILFVVESGLIFKFKDKDLFHELFYKNFSLEKIIKNYDLIIKNIIFN